LSEIIKGNYSKNFIVISYSTASVYCYLLKSKTNYNLATKLSLKSVRVSSNIVI